MLYNIHDTKFSRLLKQLVFWLSLAAMIGLFVFMIQNEVNLPQRQISLEIDLKNKVNICSPDNPKDLSRKKLYDF